MPEDQAAFLPLPTAAFDACRKAATTASSLSLVRFDLNDYSVRVRQAHHPVVMNGCVDRVGICDEDCRIASHPWLWGKASMRLVGH